jgi:uncharacterized membrane protein (DUF373 family)
MNRALDLFERAVVTALIVMMALAILGSTIDLGWVFLKDLLGAPFDLLNVGELLDIFGTFLVVLIGLELMDTVKTYLAEKRVHVKLVLMVAMIAVARKIIVLDLKETSAGTLLAIAATVLALAGGYFLMRKA